MDEEILTKKDDAKAIIGDLAEELVGKSTVEEEILVVKADKPMKDEEDDSRDQKKKKEEDEMEEEKSQSNPEPMEVTMEETQVETKPVEEEVAPVQEESAVEVATRNLMAKLAELKQKGITGDAAIKEIQPVFNSVGEVVKHELTNPVEAAAEINRSVIREEIAAAVPEIVAQIMKAIPTAQTPQKVETPAPRSIVMERSAHTGEGQKQMTQIEQLARKFTGLK